MTAEGEAEETDGRGDSSLPERVAQKLEGLPPSPGCYVFRDRKGQVLYVGRAPADTLRVLDALQTDELCPCNRQVGGETLAA